jgi:hypothetical protein
MRLRASSTSAIVGSCDCTLSIFLPIRPRRAGVARAGGEAGGRPPVPAAEQPHQRGHEQGADDGRVEQDSRGGAESELLRDHDLRGEEGAERHGEEQRRRGDDPSGSLEPDRDRLRVVVTAVARLLDAREEEHAVVGREPEDDGEEEEELGRFEAALAREAEQALESSLLEDEHEQPEHRTQAERVHQQLLQREDDGAGQREEHHEREQGDDRERERQVVAEARLQVEIVRRRSGHERIRQLAQLTDELLALRAERSALRDDVQLVGTGRESARPAHRGGAGLARGGVGDTGSRGRTALDLERDRRVAIGREPAPERVVDLPRAGRGRQHLRVDGGEANPEERRAERDQQGGRGDGGARREAHDEAGEPVPEAVLSRTSLELGTACEEAGRERVHTRAEQREHGR